MRLGVDKAVHGRWMTSHCANIGPAIGTTCLITDKTPAPSALWPLLSSRHAFYMNRRHVEPSLALGSGCRCSISTIVLRASPALSRVIFFKTS